MPLERKCVECNVVLADEYVMKIKLEDHSWETVPLSICPKCFKKHMSELALKQNVQRQED